MSPSRDLSPAPVERSGNRSARISAAIMPLTGNGEFDQIVVNHGTIPLDDLYFALKPDPRTAARWITRRWSRAARSL